MTVLHTAGESSVIARLDQLLRVYAIKVDTFTMANTAPDLLNRAAISFKLRIVQEVVTVLGAPILQIQVLTDELTEANWMQHRFWILFVLKG